MYYTFSVHVSCLCKKYYFDTCVICIYIYIHTHVTHDVHDRHDNIYISQKIGVSIYIYIQEIKKHNYFFLLVTCVVFLPADHGIRKQDLLPSAPSVTQLEELKVEGIINGCQGETLGNYDIMLIS
jgi:hypothetical protein